MIKKLDKSMQLVKIIQENPGIKFREIMRNTGMKNGVLSHYLVKLEQTGSVQVQRSPRQARFYPLNISEHEARIINALRRHTPRDIILALILHERLEFNEIVKNVKKSQSTVSLYLSQLVKEGIVKIQITDRKKRYLINDKSIIDKLIEDYHPGLLEKPTAGFEDIIDSL